MHIPKVARVAVLVLAFCASWPAFACERDPAPIFRLPSETEEAAVARNERVQSDRELVDRVLLEQRYVERAPTIYMARVAFRLKDNSGAVLKPIKAFRGELPASSTKLLLYPASLCTGAVSDGEGWRGDPGELVVIFEGVEKTVWRPDGIDSLRATSVRSPELVHWIEQFGTMIKSDDGGQDSE
jgi:hypothetical protein